MTARLPRRFSPPRDAELVFDGGAIWATVDGDDSEEEQLLAMVADDPRTAPETGARRVSVGIGPGQRVCLPFGREAAALALVAHYRAQGQAEAALEVLENATLAPAMAVAHAHLLLESDDSDALVALGSTEVCDDLTALLAVLEAVALRRGHRSHEAFGVLDRVLQHRGPQPLRRLALIERARARASTGDSAGAVADLESLLAVDAADSEALATLVGLKAGSQTRPPVASRSSPEEVELDMKEAVLRSLERELIEAEVTLATRQAELEAFSVVHHEILGGRYFRLDELTVALSERRAADDPAGWWRQQAEDARRRMAETDDAVQDQAAIGERAGSSENLRRLYREVARRVHPDLAPDAETRAARAELMAEANAAYARGDLETLARLFDHARSRPEDVPGQDAGARLVRAIRGIAVVRSRLERVAGDFTALLASPLERLRHQVIEAHACGHDLVAEIATDLDQEIAELERELGQARE